ncbi:ERF superfamily protein [compost metagenome]
MDVEDGTSVEFTSPMGSAALKGCHEVQNIGAVETYQRRYLYVTALEIVEHDALDSTTGAQQQSRQQSTNQYDWTAMIADIAKAPDMTALKKAFDTGLAAAKDANNKKMGETFGKAKDKRKAELAPQNQAA